MLYFCCHSGQVRSGQVRLTSWRNSAYKALIPVEIILADGWVVRRQSGCMLVSMYCHPTTYSLHTTSPHWTWDLRAENFSSYKIYKHCPGHWLTGLTACRHHSRGSKFPVWNIRKQHEVRPAREVQVDTGQYCNSASLLILRKGNIKDQTQTFMTSYKNSLNGLITNWEYIFSISFIGQLSSAWFLLHTKL